MRRRDDDGYTLAELIVATTLMGVVTAVTTAAVVQIYRSYNSTDAEIEAQTQITAAFRIMDGEIRYARSVSDPAVIDGDHYVEYLVNLDDVDTCVQMRLHTPTGELQRRQWPKKAGALSLTGWTTLASPASSEKPFQVVPVDVNALDGFRYQRLRVSFTSRVGSGESAAGRVTDITFTALNATAEDNSDTCTEARGVSS
ncbi:prepilin-type N-terminal cleavage/methylation domain-containing protein [Actinoplanes sp. CA-252034]|uniref:prepilin-type N-terminal cleavage/methylation domain-containing protein n=1 Tax=Actinoplanes sp. CA-252034 TaxID=3239906 RepID=UPI003D991AC4